MEDECKYYSNLNEVNSCFLTDMLNKTIIHQNIRSINKNFDLFLTYMNSWNVLPSIIVLSETWLQTCNDINLFNIDGYKSYHSGSDFTNASGIMVYVAEDCEFSCTKMPSNITGSDSIFLECKLLNYKFSVLCLYRWHGVETAQLLYSLNEFLLVNKGSDFVLLGDINININDINNNNSFQYLELLSSNGFRSLIDIDTRVTPATSTCIDHIFVRSMRHNHVVRSAVIETLITDHRAVSVSIEGSSICNENPIIVKKEKIDIEKLRTLLMQHDWGLLFSSDNVNTKMSIFLGVLDSHIKQSKCTVVLN